MANSTFGLGWKTRQRGTVATGWWVGAVLLCMLASIGPPLSVPRIASARAEAEGLRLQRQEVTPLLLELRRVENDRQAIAKWDGQLPTTTVGGSAQSLVNLPAAAMSPR